MFGLGRALYAWSSPFFNTRPSSRSVAMRIAFALAVCAGLALEAGADEPFHTSEPIFPAEKKHNHASCVVESPGGDLLVAWYSG